MVDDETIASEIIEVMQREKEGRVTFIPLNQLIPKRAAVPESADAKLMVESLTPTKQSFRKALEQVFGRTLICRDIEVAAAFARNHNVDCVTVDGDQVNRKGALTGGYLDARTSRLAIMKNIKNWREQLASTTKESVAVKKSLESILVRSPLAALCCSLIPLSEEIDQEITKVLSQMQQRQSGIDRDIIEKLAVDLKILQRDHTALQDIAKQKQNMLESARLSLKELEETKRSLEAEIGTELLDKLSDKEQRELIALNEEVATLKQQLIEASAARAEVQFILASTSCSKPVRSIGSE